MDHSESKSEGSKTGGLAPARALRLAEQVAYAPGAIVSRTIARQKGGSLTLFAFDQGQELSEHATPFDAYVEVLDGTVDLTIGGERVRATAGDTVLMPANVPHAVQASERFKMLLVMLRD